MRIFIGYLPIMFSDVGIGNPYFDVMKQPFSVPLPVPPDWYWSLSYVVLEFIILDTGVSRIWYWTGTQIGVFLIFIGIHCGGSLNLFKHQFYHFFATQKKTG